MKKLLSFALALVLVLSLAACGGAASSSAAASGAASAASTAPAASGSTQPAASGSGIAKEDLKIGVVHILDPSDQGYTYNHDLGAKYMIEKLGLSEDQYIPKFNISDQDAAATRSALQELVEAGCQIIFATSFGYGPTVAEMAKEYPEVQFAHATGVDAHFAELDNLHNYFAKIHEARYLGGIAAGLKAKEIGNPKLGYVAAVPYAEVISGYTAFFLGAQSVYPEVTMDVIYLGSWGEAQKEKEIAERLINSGAGVISQHSDSVTPAIAAQDGGAFHVGYNNDMVSAAPKASLLSARINWGIYMTEAVQHVIDGTAIPMDWDMGIVEGATDAGAAYLSPLNKDIAAEGTQEAIDAAIADILSGKQMVFQGALVDKDGKPLELYNFDGDLIFTFEDENSVFEESADFSAPAFNPAPGNSLKGINIIE